MYYNIDIQMYNIHYIISQDQHEYYEYCSKNQRQRKISCSA